MKSLIGGLLAVVSLFCVRSYAALGGDAASVDADRARMKAQRQVTQASSYALHQLTMESGTVVREYVSPAGNVFAIAWQGPFMPDMQQLLGTYFDQYSSAVKANKKTYVGRHPLNLRLSGMVIESSGYMRAYHFRAYIPQQVPAGVKEAELQ